MFRFFLKVKSNIAAVLIACYEGDTAAGSEARVAVEDLAKYLSGLGY